MKWIKLQENCYIDIHEVIFTEWRHWTKDGAAMRALDVYFRGGKAISLPSDEGEFLLREMDKELGRNEK